MKKIAWVLCSLILLFFNTGAVAAEGTSTFPAAVQSTKPTTGNVTFTCGSRVTSNPTPTNSLPTPTLSNPAGCATITCPTLNCTASGTIVNTIIIPVPCKASSGAGGDVTVNTNNTQTIGGSANTITDYSAVVVMPKGVLNFSTKPSGRTLYRINSLELKNDSVVNFSGGDYWIDTLTISGGLPKNITTTGMTRLFIKNNVSLATGLSWNTAGSADQFFIYAYSNFSISASSTIRAIIYSQKDVTLGNTKLTGAVTAEKVTLNNNSTVAYDTAAVNNLNFEFNCPQQTTQFGVNAPSIGNYCQNMTITVTAQDSNVQTMPGYTGAIILDTQTGAGTWVSTSGVGTFSGNTNNGLATYTFASGDNGTATFQLNYPPSGTAPVTIKAYQTDDSGISGVSGAINFVPAGLLVTATPVTLPTSPPPAFATTQTAGTAFTAYLTAYNPSGCGVITSYSGVKNIQFYTTYLNPATGTINATINNTVIANGVGAVPTTKPITFTQGKAEVVVQYNDVGQLRLNVIDTATNPAGPTGASGNFVVKPAAFVLHVPTAVPISQTQTAAACLNNAVFGKAGNNFTINVQARNSLGGVTPNYNNETPPQGITLNSGAIYGPLNARNGSTGTGIIGNGNGFTKITSNGTSADPAWSFPYFQGTTFTFDEVGCINLTAAVSGGNYLGAANGAVTGSLVVGRFIPDHFDAVGNTPQFKTTCTGASGSFTYLDQPFLYATQPVLTVIARALAGTTTQNYTGTAAGTNFWKLTSSGFNSVYNKAYIAVNGGDTIPSLVFSPTIPAPTFVDAGGGIATAAGAGTGTFTFADGGGLKIQRLSSTLAPAFTAEIQLRIATITDTDSVACTGTGCTTGGFSFGATTTGNGIGFSGNGSGKQFYHGRLVVLGASGPETSPLIVPMQTQFYTTANGFVLNTLDMGSSGNCTAYTGGVANISITPSTNLFTTPTMTGSPTYYFVQGLLNISLSAPTGTMTTGYADIEAIIASGGANLPWLQYNWPYAGLAGAAFTANPLGRGSFGIFRGNDRIIYQKEITQ